MTALKPRPGIMQIAPYVPGKDSVDGKEPIAKLSSNESAMGPSPKAMAAYTKAAAELHRYPDGGAEKLRTAIGRRYGLDPARIICGCGSDELLNLLIRAYCGPGDELVYSQYGFLMYPINAQGVGATPVAAPEKDYRCDVDAMLAKVTDKTRIVAIVNPNNPTGSYLTKEEVRKLHDGLPKNVLLIIDAAYAEYVSKNDYESGIDLIDKADNIVMTRTFSKVYALGGAACRLDVRPARRGRRDQPPAPAVQRQCRGTGRGRRGARRHRPHRCEPHQQRHLAAVVRGRVHQAWPQAAAQRRQLHLDRLRFRPARRCRQRLADAATG